MGEKKNTPLFSISRMILGTPSNGDIARVTRVTSREQMERLLAD